MNHFIITWFFIVDKVFVPLVDTEVCDVSVLVINVLCLVAVLFCGKPHQPILTFEDHTFLRISKF